MRNFLLSVRQIFQFQFRPHRRYCHVILGQLRQKYDVISLYQDDGRGRSILFLVSHLLILPPSEGKSLWANQISSTYLNWWLRYNYFHFEEQTSAILEFYFRFRSRPLPVICMSFYITLSNFVQIGASTAEIWRHIHFSRWWPRPLNTTSGSVFVDVTAFRKSKSIQKVKVYQQTKFCRHTSIDGWDITTSFLKNKCPPPPYSKCTSGFDFNHLAEICTLFCIRLPNFVQIGAPTDRGADFLFLSIAKDELPPLSSSPLSSPPFTPPLPLRSRLPMYS